MSRFGLLRIICLSMVLTDASPSWALYELNLRATERSASCLLALDDSPPIVDNPITVDGGMTFIGTSPIRFTYGKGNPYYSNPLIVCKKSFCFFLALKWINNPSRFQTHPRFR
jgi:hypothetical protein